MSRAPRDLVRFLDRYRLRGGLLAVCLWLPLPGWAASGLPNAGSQDAAGVASGAEIAIIIDDLGTRLDAGQRILDLPGPVTCAFLPHGHYTPQLARAAHAADKEIILHLPMQAMHTSLLDRGGLTLDMTKQAFLTTLEDNLSRVPHVQGVNNHMGSLLTRHPGHMLWLMQALRDTGGLFFVDSRTSKHTVARQIAFEQSVPSLSRDVFLDNDQSLAAVEAQFDHLLELARQQGSAVAIGHPYATTLRVLERELPRLEALGIRLVPISELVHQQYARDSAWRLSLSP